MLTANTVIYDNLTCEGCEGTLQNKDEKAILTNMTSSIFDGKLAIERGSVPRRPHLLVA